MDGSKIGLVIGVSALALNCTTDIGSPAQPAAQNTSTPAPIDPLQAPPADPPLDPIVATPCLEGDAQAEGPDGTCYTLHVANLEWSEARVQCQLAGGDLVSIESDEENVLVNELAALLDGEGDDDIWIGANDILVEDSFVWGDELVPFVFARWDNGEPDDNGGGQDCGVIEGDEDDLLWSDRDCVRDHSYMCERPGTPAVVE